MFEACKFSQSARRVQICLPGDEEVIASRTQISWDGKSPFPSPQVCSGKAEADEGCVFSRNFGILISDFGLD